TEMLGTLDTERRVWLAELYESNFAPVFKTCSSVLRNPDDAADASQEVFLIAAHSMQSGTSRASARAWLQTVARNHRLGVPRAPPRAAVRRPGRDCLRHRAAGPERQQTQPQRGAGGGATHDRALDNRHPDLRRSGYRRGLSRAEPHETRDSAPRPGFPR